MYSQSSEPTMTMTEISSDVSKRICAHMNDDHAATAHATVLSRLPSYGGKVQNAKMTFVTMQEYSISYVLCDGDACAMKTLTVPFDPPLKNSGEVRSRLIEDHHRALAPKFSWLLSDPLMRTLFGACMLLGVGTALGPEELSQRIDGAPWATAIVTRIFGSSAWFARLVVGSWYFSLAAHTLEACYTAYLCKTVLKMKMGTTFQWFVLNVAAGFPIMNKIRELVAIDSAARSNDKSR